MFNNMLLSGGGVRTPVFGQCVDNTRVNTIGGAGAWYLRFRSFRDTKHMVGLAVRSVCRNVLWLLNIADAKHDGRSCTTASSSSAAAVSSVSGHVTSATCGSDIANLTSSDV